MTAKEMFEELGFIETYEKDIMEEKCEYGEEGIIAYVSKNDNGKYDGIIFTNSKKYDVEIWDGKHYVSSLIDVNLHKAIHQQMKELGWLE